MIRSRLARTCTFLVTALAVSTAAQAEAVRFAFQDFGGDILAPTATPAHVRASPITIANPVGAFGVCWNTDLGGTNDFACGGFGSSTLAFTVTADAGWVFDVLGFTFQGLGPDEFGPTAYAVYSSLDGFAHALIGGSLAQQTDLQRYDYDAGLAATALGGPLELRIVSSGRDDFPMSAWLLDNLQLDLAVRPSHAVPEPGTSALAALALLVVAGSAAQRRRDPVA